MAMSILDTDLYKLTMQAAFLEHYPDIQGSYKYYNRSHEMQLNNSAVAYIKDQIAKLEELKISQEELEWLKRTCPYLPRNYFEFIQQYRFRPKEHVRINWDGTLSMDISGRWVDTILYEVPLLYIVSEAYFCFVDKDWDHVGQYERAFTKAEKLIRAGCQFAEFGTRRRRDYKTHDLVIRGLKDANRALVDAGVEVRGKLTGTSNVHFAQKYDLLPIGTMAHELFMGTASVTRDYASANQIALNLWQKTYGTHLGIALTDTFGTQLFLNNFAGELARSFAGVRQDSGDPKSFVNSLIEFYKTQEIDYSKKTVVFSDGLDVDKSIELQKYCQNAKINCSFGIGTFLTNDFLHQSSDKVSKPLNIVIKLDTAGGQPCVKLSDEVGKHTGSRYVVSQVMQTVGYIDP